MKKALLLLASVALLIVGCNKEQTAENVAGDGLQTVSFTVGVESIATRAVDDNDGKAANINQWVIQVMDSDGGVYHHKAESGELGNTTHTFNVPLVKGQTYNILFWADTKDSYVVTDLRQVKRSEKTYLKANADSLDAFSAVVKDFSTTVATKKDITLKRPFAQLNVVFTDLKKLYETMNNSDEYAKFKPVDFVAKAKVPTEFNVFTQEAGAPAETALVMTAAKDYLGNYTSHRAKETLYMDYIFASKDTKDVVDIDFSFVSKGVSIAHNFTSIPFQRNFRTNILGEFMSAGAQWNVTVDPIWSTPEYDVPFLAASTIAEAQSYIAPETEGTQKSKVVDLSKATITAEDIADDNTIKFELTTNSPADMVNFTLPAIPEEVIEAGCTGWKITYEEGYPTDYVNVTAPVGTNVIIEAPTSHVTLNGTVYEQVTATTGTSTLVVPAGVTVNKLIVKKGAVEIHGTVDALTVTPDKGETVVFRACEGLSEQVFAAIKGEGYDYIDSPMYVSEKVGEVYNIYKLPVVAMIGEVEYPSIAAAVAAVPADNAQPVTIKVMSDVVLKKADALTINKNNVVLDGQGYTIALDEKDEALADYVDSKYGQFKMIKVSGNTVTLKNMTLDGKKYRGASLATTVNGDNILYENVIYNGKGSAHYYSTSGNGKITFKNCKINTCGYGVHSDTATSGIVIEGCEIHGWNAFGSKVANVSIKDSKFYGAVDSKNGTLAAFSIYCPTTFTNCTFSKEFAQAGTYEGIFMAAKTLVSLNGCTVEEGELYQMVRTDDSDWPAGAVVVIDATGNATDGFTAGTFVAKQAEDIKVSSLSELKTVEGKQYVYKVSVIPVAKIGETEYETLQAAFDAVPDGTQTTITLIADAKAATLGDKNNIGAKTVILNLNGHSITGYMRGITALTGSTSLDGATLINYANLTINGEGTIGDLEGDYHHNALVNMSDGTNLTINGGTFVAKSCCVYHYSASSQANTASININGGNFKAYENAATNKYVFGIGGKSGQTLTFDYKNASAEGAKGIYCSLAGTAINVHSGSITADINAINLSMGKNVTINIDGGKLETLDSESHANNYMSNGSYAGSSLPIYASAFGSENVVCNISGGEFIYPYYSWQSSGTKPATWERVINAGVGITSNVANANITASLTGGTYSTNQMLSDITNDQSAASGIVAEGYTCKNNGDGTWTVVAAN